MISKINGKTDQLVITNYNFKSYRTIICCFLLFAGNVKKHRFLNRVLLFLNVAPSSQHFGVNLELKQKISQYLFSCVKQCKQQFSFLFCLFVLFVLIHFVLFVFLLSSIYVFQSSRQFMRFCYEPVAKIEWPLGKCSQQNHNQYFQRVWSNLIIWNFQYSMKSHHTITWYSYLLEDWICFMHVDVQVFKTQTHDKRAWLTFGQNWVITITRSRVAYLTLRNIKHTHFHF